MKLSVLDDLLWAAGFLSGAFLLSILVWRACWKQFPVLTAWLTFVTGKTVVCYVIYCLRGFSHLYVQIYWFSIWPEFALQVGVALELARAALRRNGKWVGDAGTLFYYAGFCGIVVSALLSEWIVPPHGAYASWELRGDLFTSLVVCGLLVSISLIANRLRLVWERHTLAVAQGLTALSAVCLVVNALQSYMGARNFKQIEYFQSYAWIGALVWIAMELGTPTLAAESSEHQATLGLPQGPGKNPPWLLRPLPTPSLPAFLKLFPQKAGLTPPTPPPSATANSIDGSAG